MPNAQTPSTHKVGQKEKLRLRGERSNRNRAHHRRRRPDRLEPTSVTQHTGWK